ncbi:MAG: phage-related tail protein [Microbacterium sp.]|nr:phage-related tail protein [Microbacterium sp.]
MSLGNSVKTRRALPRVIGAMVAVGALITVTACTNGQAEITPTRLLQSVAVGVTTDAAIQSVTSTTIAIGSSPSETSSESATFTPADVADDIPVRIRTSYRTADSSGTDLSDLSGYSGRVEIDVTVENLTVKPQQLTYDAAGQSRTREALVGAPLTIAASTVLGGVAPSRVVIDSDTDSTVTNGVLSRSDEGDAVVQWASLLAPPSGRASSTLTLVADVDDFSVPAFDIAVQPGISTDASMGGVLDAAFNDDPTSPLALQRRTIEVVAAVNDVLGRAGTTITEVRTNLESTADTLGVRTARELADSTTSLGTSMRGLTAQLTGLQSDLSSTVNSTNSAVLQQLGSALSAVDGMLGDTSAPPPPSSQTGSGCSTSSTIPGEANTIYGNIQRLAVELDNYASAADDCKGEVQNALRQTIGPDSPDADSCQNPSTTCALFSAQGEVTATLAQLVVDGRELVDSLKPELMASVVTQYDQTSAAVEAVQAATKKVSDGLPDGTVPQSLGEVGSALDALSGSLGSLNGALSGVNQIARDARAELGNTDVRGSIREQANRLAEEICTLAPDDDWTPPGGGNKPTPTPTSSPGTGGDGEGDGGDTKSSPPVVIGGPTLAEVDRLRSFLTSEGCEGAPLSPPWGYSAPLLDRLKADTAAWISVDEKTQPTGELGTAISGLLAQTSAVREAVGRIGSAASGGDQNLTALVTALSESTDALASQSTELDQRISALKKQQDGLGPSIERAFADADAEAAEKVSALIEEQVRVISARGKTDAATIGAMFDRSVAGLTSTSADIADSGKKTVESQRDDLAAAGQAISQSVSAQTLSSLSTISSSIGAATRDTDGASSLLQADLNKVLLDLGDRQVNGSGLLGSMVTSAAKVDTADVQLALASQQAQGYANVRSQDVAGILLQQAQTQASLEAGGKLPPFHIEAPAGAATQTVYTFRIGDGK